MQMKLIFKKKLGGGGILLPSIKSLRGKLHEYNRVFVIEILECQKVSSQLLVFLVGF